MSDQHQWNMLQHAMGISFNLLSKMIACTRLGLTREPSDRLCLMEGLASEPGMLLGGIPFEGWMIFRILFTHSTLSAMLSAFNTTALCAAREGNYD